MSTATYVVVASQLTQSAFLGQLYDIQERIEGLDASASLQDEVPEIAESLRDLAQECEDNRSNMPDSLQDSDTGNLLEERAQACNDAADELEGIDLSDFEIAETKEECGDCDGTGKAEGDGGKDGEAECPTCDGTGEVDLDDLKNSDDETEDEYWQAKLDEVQQVSIDAS